MPDSTFTGRELPVSEAFARMPLEAPGHSAWPALRAQLPRAPRRWPFALAAAAALAAVALLPGRLAPPLPGDAAPAIASQPGGDVDRLMAESAQLEALLLAVSDRQMASASTTLLGLEFEDQLQQIDAALVTSDLSADQRHDLWQQRVAVLQQYAQMQGTQQWLAAQGQALDGALVATY